MKYINFQVIKFSDNKFKVGSKIMNYLELLKYFEEKIIGDDSE